MSALINLRATETADFVIKVEQLSKTFGTRCVVNNLALRIKRGEIYGFLGPNGSGKTTTMRMLCGLLTPDTGKGICLNYDILRDSNKIKQKVGYMTQKFSLYEDLTIRENLDFVARLYHLPHRQERVWASLEQLGLSTRANQLAGVLSGGWKQRLALAACLLHEPQLLLLDEPTAGVDPAARRDFWEQIHHLSATGMTTLVSTHYMDEAERCHRLAYIAYGNLLADGTVQEVLDGSGLTTWVVCGIDLWQLQSQLKQLPAVEQAVAFGNQLHVSGRDIDALNTSLQSYQQDTRYQWTLAHPSLEDVFISLMQTAQDTSL
ncbi:ABC transporter ATP-binding protein [Beggiatoa leptomitoformis]|uniref:ATP-binding cassette domain-containing protein n=1 Tax=Beggiatoa leptomitoformis TaxID=288004 RepID=A0A2N9YC07_9GAMM|nr:ABC transporter ATP-binding protein [Beggiatoa leptomitoformis]ALG66666.1 ATP-binding cassette domain-containing protein [Beggiatoa leptomitoformis]AUI68013.1 ATP-binding cassette domain-containing protein [Beggiatoa leptomitoformis]